MSNNTGNTPKRRSSAGYIVVAVIFLMVGAFGAYYINEYAPAREVFSAAGAGVTTQPPSSARAGAGARTDNLPALTQETSSETDKAENTFPIPADEPANTFLPAAEPENTFLFESQEPGNTFPVFPEDPVETAAPEAQGGDSGSNDWNSGLNYYNPAIAIAEKCGPAVVGVINNELMYDYQRGTLTEGEVGSGSGVIISEDGYIITNYHVIENANSVTVILPGGDELLGAEVIGSDEVTDIAVLKIEKTGLPYAELGDSDALRVGELVVAIGNPLGVEFAGSVTVGYVSAVNRAYNTEEGEGYIQTDAAINPGNSGGGLFNDKGQLVGMPTFKFSGSAYMGGASLEGLGFAIPSNQIKSIAQELIENGSIYRPATPRIGVSIRDVVHSDYSPAGVLVEGVMNNSPALAAGIQMYDVITSLDGTRTENSTELLAKLKELSIGDTVEIEVYRNRRPIFLDITLFEMSDEDFVTAQAEE